MKEVIFETSDELYSFGDYSILMQALGLGEEIIINNGIADLTLWMDKDYNIFALNNNFKDLPPYNYNQEMTFRNVMLRVVPQLKKQKPKEFKNFPNRWEELKQIVEDTICINKCKDSQRYPKKKGHLEISPELFSKD